MSLNGELAELFQTFADLLQIKGEPVFKAIAFQKVSRMLGESSVDIRQAVADGSLAEMEGIGPSSQRIIEQYVKEGRSAEYEEIAASVPPGLLGMLRIPGLGPKTIMLLWKERKIESLEDLITAIKEGRLEGIKGIGEKKIEQIRQGIEFRAQAGARMGIVKAMEIAELIVGKVRQIPGVKQVEIAGSLRRRKETIGDVDLICSLKNAPDGPRVSKLFTELPMVHKVLGQGVTKASILTASGLQVDLRIVPAEHFGAALQYFTGSKEHNVRLRSLANDKGMTLNEWGLYRLSEYEKAEKQTGRPPSIKAAAGETEESIYNALGLATPDPLLREDRGEIAAAAEGKLPDLVKLADVRGDLHSHTTASDGSDSILAMAEAAKALGYEFLAITDHSKSQVIANGLSIERLLKHVKDIHKAAEQIKGIALLAGCEVDILVDGRLDFEDAILAELDWVVASPHVSLRQEQAKATPRILRAIENRYVNVIGHPTGRLIHERAGLSLDFPKIFKAASESSTALEINASWPRLDLSDVNARGLLAAGGKLSINTDAHSVGGFAAMRYGIDVARRAWARKQDVINCFSLKELREFSRRKRP